MEILRTEDVELKRICFIAQFPPPMHGLSKAVETLYNSQLNSNEYEFEKIDITNNKKIFKNLVKISKSKAELFYFTISQTKNGNLRDLIIFKLLELQHKKCLIHLHGGYYRTLVERDMNSWQRKVNNNTIAKLAGVIVLSKSLKKVFEGMIAGKKIHVVENCVDDQYLLSDAEISEAMDTLENKKILHVLWLSNFIRTKGYPIVLELAKLEKIRVVAGGESRFHFDFAGRFIEEGEKEYFEKSVSENGLEELITYHGIVDGDEKRNLLKSCDIFALPTRYPKEGQPISILEAMGNAMFIVTTDHAGIPDIVEDGVNGIVAENYISTKVIYDRLYSYNNNQIAEFKKRNREYCKLRFSQVVYTTNMKRLFRNG